MGFVARVILLLGFVGVLVAIVALLLTTRLGPELACDRRSEACSLTQQQLTKTWNNRIPIVAINRAEVRVPRGRGGSPQVWVITASGNYYFADYVLRPNADQVAQQINDFLRNSAVDARLVVVDDGRALVWLAWAFVPIIAALLVVLARLLFKKSPSPAQT
jgi:hypothetical protein